MLPFLRLFCHQGVLHCGRHTIFKTVVRRFSQHYSVYRFRYPRAEHFFEASITERNLDNGNKPNNCAKNLLKARPEKA
jgi:hypothetical protein